jgi:hypothetical protein
MRLPMNGFGLILSPHPRLVLSSTLRKGTPDRPRESRIIFRAMSHFIRRSECRSEPPELAERLRARKACESREGEGFAGFRLSGLFPLGMAN